MDISGASRAQFEDLEIDNLVLKLSGVSRAEIEAIVGQKTLVDVSGASRLKIGEEGALEELDLNVSGASRYQGAPLVAERVKIEASGASRAELGRVEFLHANASGASNISYRGNPPGQTTHVRRKQYPLVGRLKRFNSRRLTHHESAV